jgi:thymidylate kinase
MDIATHRKELWDKSLSPVENERYIWSQFRQNVVDYRNVIIESCGDHWLMPDIINKSANNPKITIVFDIDSKLARKRVMERFQRIGMPSQFSLSAELETIDYIIDHLHDISDKYRTYIQYITVEDMKSEDHLYQTLTKDILSFRKLADD